ncbi:MAG TPA: LPS export ABC transporter periplasmic protein LptC, partial [bacterium]|nr:LPS export ABC transporter periplasmic protein LptC [bacterium]
MLFEGFEKLRKLFLVIFAAMVVAFFVIVYFMKMDEYMPKPEKEIIITGTYIRVLKNSRTKWELWADTVSIDAQDRYHHLENISRGVYYRKDDPPMELKAGAGSYDAERKKLVLDGGVFMESDNGDYLRTEELLWDGRSKRMVVPSHVELSMEGNVYSAGGMEIWGDDFDGYRMKGDVLVHVPDLESSGSEEVEKEVESAELEDDFTKDLDLTAELVEYEKKSKIMKCYSRGESIGIFVPGDAAAEDEKRVVVEGRKFTMKSVELFVDTGRKFARASGKVWILKKSEQDSDQENRARRVMLKRDMTFMMDEAFYYWKQGLVDIPGRVTMEREGMDAEAGSGFIDVKNDVALLSDGVRAHQESGDWLIRDNAIEEHASDEVKDASRQETTLTCMNIEVDFGSDDLKAYGDVEAVQEDRRLRGNVAVYDGGAKLWTLSGDPFVQDRDYDIAADELLYYEEEGSYSAIGSASGVARLQADDRSEAGEYFRERDGGFDESRLEGE